MKVEFDGEGLLIKPETDFEERWLTKTYDGEDNGANRVFIKRGVTAAEVVGLRVHRIGTFANN